MVARVLQVGAHEDLMMNYYRHFSPRNVIFDFVLRRGGRPFRYRSDPQFDGNLYPITPLSESRERWMRELRELVRSGQYTHVHLHAGWANILGLLALTRLSVTRISHAHSVYPELSLPVRLRNRLTRLSIHQLSDMRLACSTEAGQQMFGSDFQLLPNLIEYERFRPDQQARNRVRSIMGIGSSDVVLGHVGQFIPAKNHSFLVKVLASLVARGVSPQLVLVGSGDETRHGVLGMAEELGVRDRIRLVGETQDVGSVLSAMDVFAFPSHFEGFGMALLEAQVSGLPCVYADAIPRAAIVSSEAVPLSLDAGADAWADLITTLLYKSGNWADRQRRSHRVLRDYDAAASANQLQSLYLESPSP